MGIRAMKRGLVDFLPKPFRDDELLCTVAQAQARSAEIAESRARLAKLFRVKPSNTAYAIPVYKSPGSSAGYFT
jgi:FixJ family two-component response regulator